MSAIMITLPDRHAFVRKGSKEKNHIAFRNVQTCKPIHMSHCSRDIGEGQEWPTVAQEADADTVCKKCAESVYGFRWDMVKRGQRDGSETRSGM